MASDASVRPDDVLRLKKPTDGFLCPQSANIYGVDFLEFRVRDMKSKKVLFHVKAPENMPHLTPEERDSLDDRSRLVEYDFGSKFFKLKRIGTMLTFRVGPERAMENFRMIERHYCGDQLIQSWDFKLGFCIPGSENNWEFIYDLPKLSKSQIADMTATPNLATSDSFYFVNDELIMHTKASYSYTAKGAANI